MPVEGVEPGTRCSHCPCHEAVVRVFGEDLCDECDDGTHAPVPGYPKPFFFQEEEEEPKAPAVIHDLPKIPASTQRTRRALPRSSAGSAKKTAGSGRKPSIAEVTIKMIQTTPLTVSTSDLARSLGVTRRIVEYYRAKGMFSAEPSVADAMLTEPSDPIAPPVPQIDLAGSALDPVVPTRMHTFATDEHGHMIQKDDHADHDRFVPEQEVEAAMKAEEQRVEDMHEIVEKLTAPKESTPAPEKPHGGRATVTLTLCEDSIDRWWRRLGIDEKAHILTQHFDCCSATGGQQ